MAASGPKSSRRAAKVHEKRESDTLPSAVDVPASLRANARKAREIPSVRPGAPPRGRAPGDASVVLVVDDDPALRALVARVVGAKYTVVEAADGHAALETLSRMHPDLVILDAAMPGIDGFEVARRIRETNALRGLPIVFLTARARIQDVQEGINVGAAYYLTKPFRAQELMARVASALAATKRRG